MVALAIVLTCWLCVLLARPRKPLPGNEVQELVYARLLGRQERLVFAAVVITMVVFFVQVVQLPTRTGAAPDSFDNSYGPEYQCVDAGRTCVTRLLDGRVHVVTLEPDGGWHALADAGQ